MKRYIYNIIAVLSIGLILIGCESEQAQEAAGDKKFELNKGQLEVMAIPLVPVKKQTIQPVVFATGIVAMAPNSEAIISANIKGKIHQILVREGAYVKKGQPLLVITSMEFIELQQSYLRSVNEAELLTLEYDRHKKLRAENVGALSELQTAESKYLIAKNTVESIGEKLKLLGVDVDRLKSREGANVVNSITLSSPIEGFIFKLHGILGMAVDENTDLVEIYNLSKLYADIDVYENDIDIIKEGQEVDIAFINQGIPKVKGVVTYILKAIDPASKAVPVHVSFTPPPNINVLPDMAVKVKINGRAVNQNAFVVPLASLMQEGELFYIYYAVPAGDDTYSFHKFKVSPGENDGTLTEISFSGTLPDNVLVVAENVYLINAEAKKAGL